MRSCFYEGRVQHCRINPIGHAFDYRICMALLDLDELPQAIDSLALVSRRRWALASFRREDHLPPMDRPLAEAVRDRVREETGLLLRGPVLLLTQLRYLGYYFSPLNLYFCMDPPGDAVEAIVAEVSNTPWREQHIYVLWEGNRIDPTGGLSFMHRKEFHVSPFMSMHAEYRWQLSPPGDRLSVRLASHDGENTQFSASMELERRPWTNQQLARLLLRYPFMTGRIATAIYYQALRLWLKQCPFYPHPKKALAPSPASHR